jgi:predicted nucleotidyltransferase
LRDYEPELKAIGVLSASVFGSVARDEAGPTSDVDVDVAVRLDNGFSQGGLDYFWQLEKLQERLSLLLGFGTRYKVDGVLKAHGVIDEFTMDDLDQDRADLRRFGLYPPCGL